MSDGATKVPWLDRALNSLRVAVKNFPARFKSEAYNEQTGADTVGVNNYPKDSNLKLWDSLGIVDERFDNSSWDGLDLGFYASGSNISFKIYKSRDNVTALNSVDFVNEGTDVTTLVYGAADVIGPFDFVDDTGLFRNCRLYFDGNVETGSLRMWGNRRKNA